MFRTRVLTLLWLLVPLVNCFNWDIVVGEEKRLEFYNNGTLTHTEYIPSANYISSVTYDPVNYRVLFVYVHHPDTSIASYDISTRIIKQLVTRKSIPYYSYLRVVYDPVTQLLFWKENPRIYSFSLNPASSNTAVDRNVLVTLNHACHDIAVDSCGGYIYWITDYEVERARFDGSEREVLIDSHVYDRGSLAIDQQTQKMYWTETVRVNSDYQLSIESANLNGKNRTTLHMIARDRTFGYSLATSKDFIYWKNKKQVGIWQIPKIPSEHEEIKLFSTTTSDCSDCHCIAANYTIIEQIQGIKSCEVLQSLMPNDSQPESRISFF